jgi:hypothetical protein
MLRPYSGQLSVGAKHLEDKLSIIAKNSSPNASPVQRSIWKINYRSLPKIVLEMLRPYSGQWLVGAKHLEDKLSVIAKNSSPNASPVQWSVVSRGEAFGR